jgi:hypothetical protein
MKFPEGVEYDRKNECYRTLRALTPVSALQRRYRRNEGKKKKGKANLIITFPFQQTKGWNYRTFYTGI